MIESEQVPHAAASSSVAGGACLPSIQVQDVPEEVEGESGVVCFRTVSSSPSVDCADSPLSKSAANFRLSSRSISGVRLYNSMTAMDKKGKMYSKFYFGDDPNIERVLEAVKADQAVLTDSRDKKRRRTVVINRNGEQKFGFTIQTYTFRRHQSNALEQVTYVDYVDLDGPAASSGLRAGDVIISINGEQVRQHKHQSLVDYMAQLDTMRMVVLFQNCSYKIELCQRAMGLKKLLSEKETELRILELQENRLCAGVEHGALGRVDSLDSSAALTGDLCSISLSSSSSDCSSAQLCATHMVADDCEVVKL